jgi:hypothetical protein
MQTATAIARDVPRWRRWGASVSLAVVPAAIAVTASASDIRSALVSIVLAGLALAAFGLSRLSVIAQVLSRGVAWLLFAPAAIATLVILVLRHMPDLWLVGTALATGTALLLSRPALATKEARAAFAPVAYRRWFLASSTVTAAAAALTGFIALAYFQWDHMEGRSDPTAFAALALSCGLFAATVGVLRMRAWGVLLGGVTALATLVAAICVRGTDGASIALLAVPGLMLGYPVLASRLRPEALPKNGRTVTRASNLAEEPRLRVQVAEDCVLDEEGDSNLAPEVGSHRLSSQSQRAQRNPVP